MCQFICNWLKMPSYPDHVLKECGMLNRRYEVMMQNLFEPCSSIQGQQLTFNKLQVLLRLW